jgi:hypothetical protein
MGFRPLSDRVLVKRIEVEEKTPRGIIIPDTAKEKPQQGEVIAVGPGGRDESGKMRLVKAARPRLAPRTWSSGTPRTAAYNHSTAASCKMVRLPADCPRDILQAMSDWGPARKDTRDDRIYVHDI